jgi:ATP-dependent Clp protease ATP-binding subunit ClpA
MSPLFVAISAMIFATVLAQFMAWVILPLVLVLWIVLIVWLLFRAQLLPEKFMDLIDKYTDKDKLLLAITESEKKAEHIDNVALQNHIESRVIGQSVVANQIAKGITRRLAQKRKNKPVFSVLLSGPTGTGKTEIAKAVTEFLFKDEKNMFRVDCGNMAEHGVSSLVGSPKGYAGSDDWGSLSKALKTNPKTIILFDEIEKAGKTKDAPLYKILLSLLDEGRLTEQSNQKAIDASQSIIIMTSNANSEELTLIAERYKDDAEQLTRASKDSLQSIFTPELLARIDLVTTVSQLGNEDKARICILHLEKLCSPYDLKLSHIDYKVLVKALEKSISLSSYGTRELIRWLENLVSDELIEAQKGGADEVTIKFEKDEVKVDVKTYRDAK